MGTGSNSVIVRLRGRQPEWLATILNDLKTRSRLLCIAPGGIGKTTLFGALAKELWETRGIRTLVLENRDRLTEQTADRLRSETGLEVDVEKGDQFASPSAPIVVMCVQSGSRIARLTAFAEHHFGLVVVDECHLALSPSWLRIIHYFHYGASSLSEGWTKPPDGSYTPRAAVVGFTASPDLGTRRNLGELFQGPNPSVNYSYLEAIEEGWLVGIKEINVPVKIDTRKFRRKKTPEGDAFSVEDQNAAMLPIIKELAAQVPRFAPNKKGIMFVPSLEIAVAMTEALVTLGVNATFVSGECIDKNEKTDDFYAAGPGAWLVNCCLYTYGVDFTDVDCIAPFGAMISKVKYIQSIYRGTRVLPGIIKDEMSVDERLMAIASSAKDHLLVLSPFFISLKIDICEPFDLFGTRPVDGKKIAAPKDLTKPAAIRDYFKALEKAADKHAHRQPRTINPVAYALSIGHERIAAVPAESFSETAKPSREELDVLLKFDIDTSAVKNSAEAQWLIGAARERKRLGLASPAQLKQLELHLGWPVEKAAIMKMGQAGVLIAQRIRYRSNPDKPQPTVTSFPTPA